MTGSIRDRRENKPMVLCDKCKCVETLLRACHTRERRRGEGSLSNVNVYNISNCKQSEFFYHVKTGHNLLDLQKVDVLKLS